MNIVIKFLETLIKKSPDIEQGKHLLLQVVRDNFPEYDQKALHEIDLLEVQRDFEQWLTNVFNTEPIPFAINSLWFGLIRLIDYQLPEAEQAITTPYVGGSKLTPKTDREWACQMDYWPECRYSNLDAFKKISISIHRCKATLKSEHYNYLESIVFLGLTYLLIRNTMYKIHQLVIGEADETYIGFGYDGGDVWIIGWLTEKGFKKT